jgi:LuxR family transcriptional regulator, regulator of acetate metabolism
MTEPTLDSRALLRRTVSQARQLTGLPVVFGGPVSPAGVVLSESAGMRTHSLYNLVVAPHRGLGGHALQARKPVSVLHYRSSAAISHDYDRQVSAEGLVSLVAIPVLEGQQTRAVLYGALRRPDPIGDLAIDKLVAAAGQLSAALRAQDRSAGAAPARHPGARDELAAVFNQLRRLADEISSPRLKADILSSCDRYAALRTKDCAQDRASAARGGLSSGELDVIALAAIGSSNREIAELLAITVGAVKSQMRSAMRKFGAPTRHGAVSAARANGLLP